MKKIKDRIKCEKDYKNKLDEILENLNVKQKQLNKIAGEKGASSWLNAISIKIIRF